MDATLGIGQEPTRLEAYRTEGYRGSSEVRVRTPPLIAGEAQLVEICVANASLLDPDDRGDPTGLVAFLVIDEHGEAHLRGVLRGDLPNELQEVIDEKETDGRPYGAVFLDQREMDVARALMRDHNVLLVGPTGTGKTRMMTRVRHAFEQGIASLGFDPDASEGFFGSISDPDSVFEGLPRGRASRFVTFHPSLTYEDFMVGIRPSVNPSGDLIFDVASGTFLELAAIVLGTFSEEESEDNGRDATAGLLLVDEFNRGNVPEIFGEVITLLESDKRLQPNGLIRSSTVTVRLAMTPHDVGLDRSIQLPHHLYLLASMNSVDRSVAPIDSALRRRFRIIDVPPDLEVARRVLLAGSAERPGIADLDRPSDEECRHLAVAMLAAVNEDLSSDWGWEFELGHSYILGIRDFDSLLTAWNETIRPHLNAIYRDGPELMDDWLSGRRCEQLADGRRTDLGIAGEGAVTLRLLSSSPEDVNLLHRLAWGRDAEDVLALNAEEPEPQEDDGDESTAGPTSDDSTQDGTVEE